MSRRRWARIPPIGAMVNHPAVALEAGREESSRRPVLKEVDGSLIVTYERTRFWIDRDAWEMLPSDGVMLIRVSAPGSAPLAFALTAQELEDTFNEVRQTRSWQELRCYHFPAIPAAAHSFLVASDGALEGREASGRRADSPRAKRSTERIVELPCDGAPSRRSWDAAHADFHEWATGWYGRLGARPESPAYLDAVEAWRMAWRPDRVRVLLVAESHVAERDGDAGVSVLSARVGMPELAKPFVRLIYCLGYGEPGLCVPKATQNSGTWQFWNIFGQIAFDERQPRRTGSREVDRVDWKIRVLTELRRRGIWLQDASPLGIYLGGGRRVAASLQQQLLREGYLRYVWPSVVADEPEKIWVIGKGVHRALAGLPGIDASRVISQPQDRTPGVHVEGLGRLCADLA